MSMITPASWATATQLISHPTRRPHPLIFPSSPTLSYSLLPLLQFRFPSTRNLSPRTQGGKKSLPKRPFGPLQPQKNPQKKPAFSTHWPNAGGAREIGRYSRLMSSFSCRFDFMVDTSKGGMGMFDGRGD